MTGPIGMPFGHAAFHVLWACGSGRHSRAYWEKAGLLQAAVPFVFISV